MGIPNWRKREIAAKEFAREERYRDRLGDLVGLDASSNAQPHTDALFGDAGIVCLECRQFCGVSAIPLTMPGETRCERCGRRVDHVLKSEPR